MRRDLTWHNLEGYVKSKRGALRILDAGCGLGDMADFLLGRARSLVLLDFSEKMLERAKKRLWGSHSGFKDPRLTFIHGRVEELDSCLPEKAFDVILCHTLLEYVEAPRTVLAALVERLVSGGFLSLVTTNCFSEALRLAILKNDLPGARRALHQKNHEAAVFDHVPRHTFSLENLVALLDGLGLTIKDRFGIRVFSDYMPEDAFEDPKSYRDLLELEKEASKLPPYSNIARYLHLICQKGG